MLLEIFESVFIVAVLLRHTKALQTGLGPLAAAFFTAAAGATISALGESHAAGIDARANQEIARIQAQGDLDVAREQNRGALERQNDLQEFEQFLIDRQNVAGGPAYGGPSAEGLPDFWSGLTDVASQGQISGFFDNMQRTEGLQGESTSFAPEPIDFYSQAERDPNAPLSYGVREEYENPLFNLRRRLGLGAGQTPARNTNGPASEALSRLLRGHLGG